MSLVMGPVDDHDVRLLASVHMRRQVQACEQALPPRGHHGWQWCRSAISAQNKLMYRHGMHELMDCHHRRQQPLASIAIVSACCC